MTVIISVLIGLLDSLGLAMFLPLLQMVSDSPEGSDPGLGNLQFIVNAFENSGISLNIINVLLILCVFFISKGVAKYFGNYYQVLIRQYFMRKIRYRLVNSFSQISFRYFINSDVGQIQNTFTTETERLTNAFVHYFRSADQFIVLLVYIAFAFSVDSSFAAFVSLGGFLINLLYGIVYRKSKIASREVTQENHNFQGLIIQFISNFKYLRGTGTQRIFGEKLEKSINTIEKKNVKLGVYSAILVAAREPSMIVIISGVIILQTAVLGASLAPILVSLLFFYRALASLNNVQTSWNSFIRLSGSLDNMVSFQSQIDKNGMNNNGSLGTEFDQNIQLNNVSLSFDQKAALDNISISIGANESVAIVGESGSGKTTLLSVLSGLLKPETGSMEIDGTSLEQIDIGKYQRLIGYIQQDPIVFNDTLFNNVTLWSEKTESNLNKFWRAMEMASAKDFAEVLEMKENTILGINGANLSGGQKQRICIARELYKGVKIFMMDEGTSALDGETELIIRDSLRRLKGTCTLIIVAHRISTIKDCDRIILMDSGKVLRSLPYEELLIQESKFKKMVTSQEL